MNLHDRAQLVRAMDMIARSCNDEHTAMYWLENGVADGDVNGTETDEDLRYYCENLSELMDDFLYTMALAKKHGGLYFDGIIS